MQRVDSRTNALPTDRQTDRPTDRPTDTASFRGALSHLKIILRVKVRVKMNAIFFKRAIRVFIGCSPPVSWV